MICYSHAIELTCSSTEQTESSNTTHIQWINATWCNMLREKRTALYQRSAGVLLIYGGDLASHHASGLLTRDDCSTASLP